MTAPLAAGPPLLAGSPSRSRAHDRTGVPALQPRTPPKAAEFRDFRGFFRGRAFQSRSARTRGRSWTGRLAGLLDLRLLCPFRRGHLTEGEERHGIPRVVDADEEQQQR